LVGFWLGGEQSSGNDETRDEAVTQTTVPDGAAGLEPFPGGGNAVARDTDLATSTVVQQRDNSGPGATQVFTPHLYQRLPHPLSNLIKELETVDRTKVQQLCDFLLKVLKIKEIGQLSEASTFELIFPRCREELLGAVEQAIRDGKDFEHFFARVLRQFIPSRQMAQIRLAIYERVQKEGESFSRYIQAIRDAAKVLRIQESETQIVQRIIEGINLINVPALYFKRHRPHLSTWKT
jgi:hypothetical protein